MTRPSAPQASGARRSEEPPPDAHAAGARVSDARPVAPQDARGPAADAQPSDSRPAGAPPAGAQPSPGPGSAAPGTGAQHTAQPDPAPRPTVYVDADACPVRAEAEAVATRHGVPLVLVCNGGIRPSAHPLVRVVYVDAGADAADRWIAERAGPGDVVVTADLPLAARCLEGGARVLQPDGGVLTAANIGPRLATRDLMADLRAADPTAQGAGRQRGGRLFAAADRGRFRAALDRALAAGASPAGQGDAAQAGAAGGRPRGPGPDQGGAA